VVDGAAPSASPRAADLGIPTGGDGRRDEHGAQAGVGVGLERSVGGCVVEREVAPVDDRRDPGLHGAQQADQGGRVDVIGQVVLPDVVGRDPRVRPALAEVAEQRLPRVTVAVDEPGHDDRVRGVDRLRVPRAQTRADLGHPAVLDQDVGPGVVGRLRAQGEDAAPAEQGPHRHVPLRVSTDLATVS
jgi:hypothetical protein